MAFAGRQPHIAVAACEQAHITKSLGVNMSRHAAMQNPVFAATFVAATIGALPGSVQTASAQVPKQAAAPASLIANVTMSDLEEAFWVCDYLATTQGVSDVFICSTLSEALKQRRFAGDLDGLLSWWRENKVARHREIAAARGDAVQGDPS